MLRTPILLIAFNRPDHVRQVLTEVLKQNPQDLYVCQDGARENNTLDRVKCQEVRDVVNELTSAYAISNKEFRLHTLYQEKNLGCGPGPAAGISWFFEHVEMGIILEDDAVLHPNLDGISETQKNNPVFIEEHRRILSKPMFQNFLPDYIDYKRNIAVANEYSWINQYKSLRWILRKIHKSLKQLK